jgi:hypothetical protein
MIGDEAVRHSWNLLTASERKRAMQILNTKNTTVKS